MYYNRTTFRNVLKILYNDNFEAFLENTNGIIYQYDKDGQMRICQITTPRDLIPYYADTLHCVQPLYGHKIILEKPSGVHILIMSNNGDNISEHYIKSYQIDMLDGKSGYSEDLYNLMVLYNSFSDMKPEDQYII